MEIKISIFHPYSVQAAYLAAPRAERLRNMRCEGIFVLTVPANSLLGLIEVR